MTSSVFGRVSKCTVAILLLTCVFLTCLPDKSHGAFKVDRDGFSISNAPGWCFAMAAFARWYYLMNQDAPHLREMFDERSQQRIAGELQAFYSRNLLKIQAEYCNRDYLEKAHSFARLVAGLTMGEPRIVLLMNKSARGVVLHAVLAYVWLPDSNSLMVYDPNYCNRERVIELDKGEYTSLDVTYHAFCFPEVLHQHAGLVKKMETLCATCLGPGAASGSKRPVAKPLLQRAHTMPPESR
jgi:hypothetical protein